MSGHSLKGYIQAIKYHAYSTKQAYKLGRLVVTEHELIRLSKTTRAYKSRNNLRSSVVCQVLDFTNVSRKK